MKKWFTLLCVIVLMLSVIAPASAAVTDEWVDPTLEIKGLTGTEADIKKQVEEKIKMEVKGEIVDFSTSGSTDVGAAGHRICYEYNVDLENTVLLKQDNDRKPSHTEYITYKMKKNIGGFELLTQCCAGIGDPREDISVFISKTGAEGSWAQVATQATYYEFDPNIYLKWDKAYWFMSTVTNADVIPAGYKYLKIQFNPCNEQGDVPWNVAVDSVKILMGSNVPVTEIPAGKKLTQTWDEINAERDATKTTTGNNTTAGGKNTTTQAGGKNTTTSGKNITTAAGGKNTTTATDAPTTTATNENGEIITDPTTTATNENGEIITNPTNADGAVDGNDNASGDAATDPVKKGNALPWIIGGGVVVLAGVAAAFILIRKKQG